MAACTPEKTLRKQEADKSRSFMFLSLLCFSLADVRDGLGPFLGVFLQSQGWTPEKIGYAMTAGDAAGLIFVGFAGAIADKTEKKRLLLLLSTAGIVAASALPFINNGELFVFTSKIMQGIFAAAVAPALTAVTLGLAGQKGMPARLGKNEAWNHFGNCSSALISMIAGYYYGMAGVLAVTFFMGAVASLSLAFIDPADIDNKEARGLSAGNKKETPSFKSLFSNKALLSVAFTLFFFHLGNAAMLPLLGQSAAARFDVNPALYTAATIFIAQTTMIGTSLISVKIVSDKGYGILFTAALAVLPVRGITAYLYDSPWSIIPVQIMDGVCAGFIGVATPGLAARLLKGTGHVNAGLGFILAVQGLGAALSNGYGGLFAGRFGYGQAFFMLALAPLVGLALFLAAAKLSPHLSDAVSPFGSHDPERRQS